MNLRVSFLAAFVTCALILLIDKTLLDDIIVQLKFYSNSVQNNFYKVGVLYQQKLSQTNDESFETPKSLETNTGLGRGKVIQSSFFLFY